MPDDGQCPTRSRFVTFQLGVSLIKLEVFSKFALKFIVGQYFENRIMKVKGKKSFVLIPSSCLENINFPKLEEWRSSLR